MHSFLYSVKREIARGTSQTARRSLQLNHRNPVRSHRIPSDLIRCLIAAQLGTVVWLDAKSNSQKSEKHEIIPELGQIGPLSSQAVGPGTSAMSIQWDDPERLGHFIRLLERESKAWQEAAEAFQALIPAIAPPQISEAEARVLDCRARAEALRKLVLHIVEGDFSLLGEPK